VFSGDVSSTRQHSISGTAPKRRRRRRRRSNTALALTDRLIIHCDGIIVLLQSFSGNVIADPFHATSLQMSRYTHKLRYKISAHIREHYNCHTHTTTVLRPFFRDHPVEPVPEENLWTLWCKGRFTEADTLTIRLGAIPSGLTSAHLHHPPHIFYRPHALPAAQPTAKMFHGDYRITGTFKDTKILC